MKINPEIYNLPPRTELELLNGHCIAIRKVIKSRIIMKDAERIVRMAAQIKNVHPILNIQLICNRNICSKSVRLLEHAGIGIVYTD